MSSKVTHGVIRVGLTSRIGNMPADDTAREGSAPLLQEFGDTGNSPRIWSRRTIPTVASYAYLDDNGR